MLEPLSPFYALGGGLLIGSAAAVFLLLSGRIAGVSGIAASAARISSDQPWFQALAFLIALPLGALLVSGTVRAPQIDVTGSAALLVAAGLLVGYGTRLGSGCTSGHGVCGMARLSPRSLAATAMFMAFGFATVFAVRHLAGAAA